jgi:hypothetical protein
MSSSAIGSKTGQNSNSGETANSNLDKSTSNKLKAQNPNLAAGSQTPDSSSAEK